MAKVKHNQSCRLSLAFFALAMAGCGELRSRQQGEPEGGESYVVPDSLRSPPPLSAVAPGSRKVVSAPDPGATPGPFLLQLLSEPGATIQYSFHPIDEATPDSELKAYSGPLYTLPPAVVFAKATKDGQVGALANFAFEPDGTVMPAPASLTAERLPVTYQDAVAFDLAITSESFQPEQTSSGTEPSVDGKDGDWGGGRLLARDASHDTPFGLAYMDLLAAEAFVGQDRLTIVLRTREPPRKINGVNYGVEIGTTGISLSSFGSGADYHYRLELANGTIGLVNKADGSSLPLSQGAKGALGDVVELTVPWSDLPALAGAHEVALRAFSFDGTVTPNVYDRVEPIFVRSLFGITRTGNDPGAPERFSLDLLTDPTWTGTGFAQDYLALGRTLLPELEGINRIPFYGFHEGGTLPLFFVTKEENGYAGLNTSDRGLLTTIGPNTSLMARAQLLAHELAHYQNARMSQLTPRWLQEGMSEWSSERLLYRHFPLRAAYRFLRGLRFDRLADRVSKQLDDFKLGTWTTEAEAVGYEKGLIFLDLLEGIVGQQTLIEAFRVALNEPMDTPGFRAYLERRTGKSLAAAFPYWVDDGAPAADMDPRTLLADPDGDGLLTIDELKLGTDPNKADTDGDGIPDGEEYFRGLNPLTSALGEAPADTVLVVPDNSDTSEWMRLGGATDVKRYWDIDARNTAPTTVFSLPQTLRPPYQIAVVTEVNGVKGAAQVFTRKLVVNGTEVDTTLPQDNLLPPTPLASTVLPQAATRGDGFGGGDGTKVLPMTDVPGDLPKFLAAYDLIEASAAHTGSKLNLTLKTRAPAAPFGEFGDISLTFDKVSWGTTGPTVTRKHTLTLSGGAPYWYDSSGAADSSHLLASGISLAYGTNLDIALDDSLLADWLSGAGDAVVCASTVLNSEGADHFRERAGCITLVESGFVRRGVSVAAPFGIGTHQVELFSLAATDNPTLAAHLLDLGAEAIRQFETVLGRPLLDRNHWPIHVVLQNAQATVGSATQRAGAFLYLDSSLSDYRLDYLFVEQLARLALADLLERSGDRPYWIQEVYVQWLTGSALSRFYKTAKVHQFHSGRINDFICYEDSANVNHNACLNYFDGDVALSAWDQTTGGSTGSVKSLIFVLQLDALIGADAVGELFSRFTNSVPDTAGMKTQVFELAAAAGRSTQVTTLWNTFVVGSGDALTDWAAIKPSLRDQDGDLLMKFEEDKLGTLDTVVNNYLN